MKVNGITTLNKTLFITTPAQGGGNIRILPSTDLSESSIGYYTRNDARCTEIGDAWICGANTWGQNINGFSLGTPGLGSCLNIVTTGSVVAPYKFLSPTIQTNKILSYGDPSILLDDNIKVNGVSDLTENVYVGGVLYKNSSVITSVNNNKTFSINEILNGIILVGATSTGNTIFTVPSGTAVWQGVNTVIVSAINKSFEWSVINIGLFAFNLSSATVTGHTIIGNNVVLTNTSGRFMTRITAVNVAITYRLS